MKQGRLRKIALRLYTTNMMDSPESIVKRNILSILNWRFPNTVISHRSACEMRITSAGTFYLTGNYNRKVTDLPGVTIYMLKGPVADSKDMAYGKMYIASEYRWMLENMQTSRKQGDESKTLPPYCELCGGRHEPLPRLPNEPAGPLRTCQKVTY